MSIHTSRMIDLRSDTVTLPSPAMRTAIAQADLGDDVYGEDPTVNQLEQLAAQIVGKEAALLVVSGTMGNLSALLTHCARGQRAIVGSESHIFNYEAGGAAALGGIVYQTVPNLPDGRLDPAALQAILAWPDDPHHAPAGVICLENTHNRCGGAVLTPDYLAEVHTLARQHGLPLHLDGARVFNAAVALNIDVQELTRHVDTVQFCLSKGLAAPVGSIVAGSRPFINQVRRVRKMLGGGMRQAGIIAAAGCVALNEMIPRLAEDQANARLLAAELAQMPGIILDVNRVHTNIVIFELSETAPTVKQFLAALQEQGILMGGFGGRYVRAVTHYGISSDDVHGAIAAVREALNSDK